MNTKEDRADLATRGITAEALADNKPWFHGPEFLLSDLNNKRNYDVTDFQRETLPECKSHKIEDLVVVNELKAFN